MTGRNDEEVIVGVAFKVRNGSPTDAEHRIAVLAEVDEGVLGKPLYQEWNVADPELSLCDAVTGKQNTLWHFDAS
mgnify:CR=1 FL=1